MEDGVEATACCRHRRKALAPWRFNGDFDGSDTKHALGTNGSLEDGLHVVGDAAVNETDGNLDHGLGGGGVADNDDNETNGEANVLSNTTSVGQCNGAPTREESSSATEDGKSQGLGSTGGAGWRRGRKALAPWRFQRGYNRSTEIAGRGAASVPKTRTKFSRAAISRESLMASLQEFRVMYPSLLEEERNKCSKLEDGSRITHDLAAFQVWKERLCVEYDDRKLVGSVPGVQVGDVFDSSMELFITGLHRSEQSCVDYVKRGRGCLAVSIVSSAQNEDLDFLLHVGSTVATADQKMEGTDQALKRSMDTGTHVRVIYRSVVHQSGGNSPSKEQLTYFVYGGLYLVEKFCREELREDQFVTTFNLRRLPGQPHINMQQLVKNRMAEPSNGTFIGDLSGGLEKIPISAINSISNEYLLPFHYISHIEYPLENQPDPPSGCDCVGLCSDSPNCACAVKNGGKIPFSKKGRIFGEKPLIYECGPACKCPSTCHNRASQQGIKFRLQVFKTESMGWGVRSLDFITEGSFVCEYIGELLEHEDAEKRENDEYLFSIGHNYYNVPRWDDLAKSIPSLRNGPGEAKVNSFALDALKCGNFARFINHCCTPNLFSQNLLYDHDDKSMPHIAFFADVDIDPLQPLSYDYNYVPDGVHDSEGNIKKKQCLCGSTECSEWLY